MGPVTFAVLDGTYGNKIQLMHMYEGDFRCRTFKTTKCCTLPP